MHVNSHVMLGSWRAVPPQEDISELEEAQESVYEYQDIGNEEESFWGNEVYCIW